MIIIKFDNLNSRTLTSIDIYREPLGTAIPDTPTSPPIAKLDGFATEYVDNDTVLGQDYNYRFKVYREGGASVMSDTIVLGDVSLYGPGNYYEASSGTDTIWHMGLVEGADLNLLPSITDLAMVSGPTSEFRNWSGKWMKFKIGSDIYYTPYRAAIYISSSEYPAFLSRITNPEYRDVDAGYCSYSYIQKMDASNALAVLDGRSPTKWGMFKEYPRQNATEPFIGKGTTVALLFSVADDRTGQFMVQTNADYRPCLVQTAVNNATYSLNWLWKPILKFNPKSTRNYA